MLGLGVDVEDGREGRLVVLRDPRVLDPDGGVLNPPQAEQSDETMIRTNDSHMVLKVHW